MDKLSKSAAIKQARKSVRLAPYGNSYLVEYLTEDGDWISGYPRDLFLAKNIIRKYKINYSRILLGKPYINQVSVIGRWESYV